MTFPVDESFSAGLTNSVGNTMGFALIMGVTPILNNQTPISNVLVSAIFTGVLLLSVVFIVVTKEQLKRKEAKEQAS